jgi:hypothetical protein
MPVDASGQGSTEIVGEKDHLQTPLVGDPEVVVDVSGAAGGRLEDIEAAVQDVFGRNRLESTARKQTSNQGVDVGAKVRIEATVGVVEHEEASQVDKTP